MRPGEKCAKTSAHNEIKNPLKQPIQLSAERLQHNNAHWYPQIKQRHYTTPEYYRGKQVEAHERICNEFSDLARSPGLQLDKVSIGEITPEKYWPLSKPFQSSFTLIEPVPTESASNLNKNRNTTGVHKFAEKRHWKPVKKADKAVDMWSSYHVPCSNICRVEIIINDQGPGFSTRNDR